MNPVPPGRQLLFGTVVSDGAVHADAVVAVDGDRFADATVVPLPPHALILPGLVELHCHGAYGGDFPTGEETPARRAIDFLHRSGTTTLLASLVTAAPESLLHAIALHARLSR